MREKIGSKNTIDYVQNKIGEYGEQIKSYATSVAFATMLILNPVTNSEVYAKTDISKDTSLKGILADALGEGVKCTQGFITHDYICTNKEKGEKYKKYECSIDTKSLELSLDCKDITYEYVSEEKLKDSLNKLSDRLSIISSMLDNNSNDKYLIFSYYNVLDDLILFYNNNQEMLIKLVGVETYNESLNALNTIYAKFLLDNMEIINKYK